MYRRLLVLNLAIAGIMLSACNTTGSSGGSALSEALQTASSTMSGSSSRQDSTLSAAGDLLSAATINDNELKNYSKQMIQQEDKENHIAKPGSKYAKRLNRLTRKHVKEDGLTLNFKVYIAKDVNAFATPDGSIRVYSGLMDLMTDNELMSVIGHEIGHVKLGHSLEKMRIAYLTSAGTKIVSSQTKLGSSLFTEMGSKFINAQFSQNAELQSDAYGVAFMKKHRYNPAAAESAMKKLAELGDSASFFSSHPSSTERAEKIRALISEK